MQALVRRRLRRTIELENLIKTISEMDQPLVTERALKDELRIGANEFATALKRAIDGGWVQRGPDGALSLTSAGEARGRRLARAHVLWEQFLTRQVGLAPDHVHDAAEWIEHHLDEEEVRRLDAELARGNAGV
jgi:Mn-dependent DtxR family transcriptional regulator